MTSFEDRTLRELVRMKAREVELTETEEGERLAEELKRLVKEIYAFQQQNNKAE